MDTECECQSGDCLACCGGFACHLAAEGVAADSGFCDKRGIGADLAGDFVGVDSLGDQDLVPLGWLRCVRHV